MIPREVFYARKEICQPCAYWRGACLKGHPLQSPVGCPIKKFEPIQNAGYHPDKEVPVTDDTPGVPCCGDGVAVRDDVEPLSWSQALSKFAESMKKAHDQGWPLVSDQEHGARNSICRSCTQYRYFQCRICRCVAWAKAALASEDCPQGFWPKRS